MITSLLLHVPSPLFPIGLLRDFNSHIHSVQRYSNSMHKSPWLATSNQINLPIWLQK